MTCLHPKRRSCNGFSIRTITHKHFMTSLEGEVIPKLTPYLCNWKRYADDTYAYVNPEKVDFILTKLNSPHPNIQFTFELEKNKQITFLDVLIKRTIANQIEKCVHRNGIHAPMEWKIGTLRNLLKRAKTVCSTTVLLHQEIEHLKAVFTGINEYSIKTVNRIINQELHQSQRLQNTVINNGGIQKVQIMLPYNGKQGHKLLSKMKKHLNKSLPTEVKTTVTYQSKKLGTKFQLKDKTRFNHQNNLVYYSKCPDKTCNEDYVGETDRKIEERIMDHNKRDKNSHLLKHSREKNHQHVWENDFKVLGNNYRSNFKEKISEFSLNFKEKSIQLQLYN